MLFLVASYATYVCLSVRHKVFFLSFLLLMCHLFIFCIFLILISLNVWMFLHRRRCSLELLPFSFFYSFFWGRERRVHTSPMVDHIQLFLFQFCVISFFSLQVFPMRSSLLVMIVLELLITHDMFGVLWNSLKRILTIFQTRNPRSKYWLLQDHFIHSLGAGRDLVVFHRQCNRVKRGPILKNDEDRIE